MVYVGSKARLAKYIVPILQGIINKQNIDLYIEPFVGGANIIDKINCTNKYGYDIHAGLINLYRNLQNGWLPPVTISEEEYNLAKNGSIDEPLRTYIGFAGSYATKYFGGFARGFKSDGITPRDRFNEVTRNLLKQVPNLMEIIFDVKNYKDINLSKALIYCDPPYENTTQYKVERFNHDEFWEWCRDMSKNNIVIISEFKSPDDFVSIWQKERVTSLDKNTGGTRNTEHLFIHKSRLDIINE